MKLFNKKGYTLIELLVVIGIIAVLASISVPVISGIVQKAKLNADNSRAQGYETAISLWKSEIPSDQTVYYSNLSSTHLIGTKNQSAYTNAYMGTRQLPGIEFVDERQIRHATIAAIESLSLENINPTPAGDFYLEHPETSGYGYKYYYRAGKISVEKVDSTHTISNDEAYKYWIWLDNQPTAPVSICTTPITKYEKIQGATSSSVTSPAFCFSFSIPSTDDINKCVFTIENEECSYTLSGKPKTAQIFITGTYTIKFYYAGELKADSPYVVRPEHIQDNTVVISYDGNTSSMQLSSNKNDFVFDGTKIAQYTGSDEVVVIPPTNHAGIAITEIKSGAFSNCTAKRIIIPDSVTKINTNAFSFCSNLVYMSIPSSNLAESCIVHCPKLETIDFYSPNTVNLLSVSDVKNNIRTIAYNAIHNCRKLTHINLTSLYRSVDSGAFEQLKTENSILDVTVDITKDDMRTTFHQKSYVKFNYTNFNMFKTTTSGTIYFSDNAKNLQDGSRRLAIPHLVLIGSTAYQYTSIASPTQAQLTAVNSLKQSYDELVIANGYVNVGNSAFKGFQFKTISLPSSLKTIGNDAFAGNKCLSIEVPSSVTQINDRAFSSETLETIILRCNADALSNNALAGCSRLKTILIYDYTGDKSQITPQKFGLGDDVAIIFA